MKNFLISVVVFFFFCFVLHLVAEQSSKKMLFVEKVWPDGPIVRIVNHKGQEVSIDTNLENRTYEVIWVAPEHFRK